MTRLLPALLLLLAPADAVLKGRVLDADSGKPIPCRITIRAANGTYYFAASEGSAIEYDKQAGQNKASFERHTTLSAHPFTAKLPPGNYVVTVQHGKEYLSETKKVEVDADGAEVEFKLKRWIDMAARGWYSGETHVHRMPDVLPNLMLAEDLNVALPLTSWVTESNTAPGNANKAGASVMNDPHAVEIDETHVFYPRNTEYEIFRVGKKNHTLGALFILNHKTLFEKGLPPVKPIVDQARAEGALLELDKHNWPWSMMLAPVFKVDLYELANNHLWETEFAFRDFGEPAPEYMGIEKDAKGMTERGWLDYGFLNYYALLNCGLRMRPTAGCASGVHPVPLGFSRVYVHLDGPFSYDAWMKGLDEGHSFVTTGPMLAVKRSGDGVTFEAESAFPLSDVELIIDGRVSSRANLVNAPTPTKGFRNAGRFPFTPEESAWVAVRCFEERPDGRLRWAHSAPLYFEEPGKPLRPRKVEVEFLLKRVEDELARNKDILDPASLDEYRQAAEFYRGKLEGAR